MLACVVGKGLSFLLGDGVGRGTNVGMILIRIVHQLLFSSFGSLPSSKHIPTFTQTGVHTQLLWIILVQL